MTCWLLRRALWSLAALLALIGRALLRPRRCLVFGGLAVIAAAHCSRCRTAGLVVALPSAHGRRGRRFRIAPEALWLMGFGLTRRCCRVARHAAPRANGRGEWLFGAAVSLLGALGVFGLQKRAAS